MGLQPARGNWKYRLFDSHSTATFVGGSLVAFDVRRDLIEYSSAQSQPVGIALHASVDSLPRGKVLVAVPLGEECTFYAQTGTIAVSSLSLGQRVGIIKSGNTVDQLSVAYSTASQIGYIYGKVLDTSTVSKIEVYWTPTGNVWGSLSTNTFLS
jgi:hypothetical protein